MVFCLIIIVLLGLFIFINILIKKTNGYKNFARSIHVVKDVPQNKRYAIGVFGSTFSYYAFDLKHINGHNFSVAPQCPYYTKKTIEHFIHNIEKDGRIIITLTGCFFASKNSGQEENCITYQSFLSPKEFENYLWLSKVKYLISRYLPIFNPNMVKYLFYHARYEYGLVNSISEDDAMLNAKERLKGWKKILGVDKLTSFSLAEDVVQTYEENVQTIRKTIHLINENNRKAILVVLPMSHIFNECCGREFYEKILYKGLHELEKENVIIFDYLNDKDLNQLKYYWTADCLNVQGRQALTNRFLNDLCQYYGDKCEKDC